MEIIENSVLKEKLYKETLDNDLEIFIIPKKTKKKYIVWACNVGSVDNKFFTSVDDKEITILPDGIAHYLEHKLFEQRNGTNSLDVLTTLGVDANAYTTNDHTAFLYECTENFDEALDEFMDYVQNPYFTDKNVEKECGIIEQEIKMYDDYPEWRLYMNAMKAMYSVNEINIDTAGTVESIAQINKEKLYALYNSFYTPENMIIVMCGDFEPEEALQKIKDRMIMKSAIKETIRVYNREPETIVKEYVEDKMSVSMPLGMIAFKDVNLEEEKIRKVIAIELINSILFSKSSLLYENLYNDGKLITNPTMTYEFGRTFAHVMISFQTNYVDDVITEIKKSIEDLRERGINKEDLIRAKKSFYGDVIRDYNDVSTIATELVSSYFKDINVFDYLEELEKIDEQCLLDVLDSNFNFEKMVVSVIK